MLTNDVVNFEQLGPGVLLKLHEYRDVHVIDSIIPLLFEPRHKKTNILVSDLVRHKPGCTVTEDG